MLTQQISSETGNWMNDAVAEVFQAFGMDEKSAQIAANVAIMVAGIALSLGAGATTAAAAATTTAMKVAKIVSQGAKIAAGVSAIGQGTAQAVATETKYQAT